MTLTGRSRDNGERGACREQGSDIAWKAAIVAVVGGCYGAPLIEGRWFPEVTPRDRYECRREAQERTRPFSGMNWPGMATVVFRECMEARGYKRVEE